MATTMAYDRSFVNGVRSCATVTAMAGRSSALEATRTRRAILRASADLASVEGLDSVTIGRLAERLEMSKSGVIGHFRSKGRLQEETVQLVVDDFRQRVWEPVQRFEAGLPRLLAACQAWVEYGADPGFPGGCLLTQATYDYDGRPGPVHDLIARSREAWRRALRRDVEAAVQAGALASSLDVEVVVYGLESLAAGITPARFLSGEESAGRLALRAMHSLLGVEA